jgi:cold shock CspA family protein
MYNDQRKFGFILDEDGEDRFFHISNVKSLEQPIQGMSVEFVPAEGEKGLIAKDVYLQAEKDRPTFIAFGATRIKLSDIKQYGFKEEEYKVEVPAKDIIEKCINFIKNNDPDLIEAGEYDTDCDGLVWNTTRKVTKKRQYLYITTYQNDNHKFYEKNEDGFDIYEKRKELDKWLC